MLPCCSANCLLVQHSPHTPEADSITVNMIHLIKTPSNSLKPSRHQRLLVSYLTIVLVFFLNFSYNSSRNWQFLVSVLLAASISFSQNFIQISFKTKLFHKQRLVMWLKAGHRLVVQLTDVLTSGWKFNSDWRKYLNFNPRKSSLQSSSLS